MFLQIMLSVITPRSYESKFMGWIVVFFVVYIIIKTISKDDNSPNQPLITKTNHNLKQELKTNTKINNKKKTNSKKKEIIELLTNTNLTSNEIAKKVNVTPPVVWAYKSHITMGTYDDKKQSKKTTSEQKGIIKKSTFGTKTTDNQKSIEQSLKQWRYGESEELKIPAFRILSNSTLKAIVEYLPINKLQLKKVKGVGPQTIENYGEDILRIINDIVVNRSSHKITITTDEVRKKNIRLVDLPLKPNWRDFQKILNQNYITTLYHFTDMSNINSIHNNGGLYSWFYMENKGIQIPTPGGNQFSRQLDRQKGLQDYVRLSFNTHQPMMYIAKKDHRIKDPRILKIDPQVIYWNTTNFSNLNAADNNAEVGNNISNFKNIRFTIAKQNKYYEDEIERKLVQAEVLVKTHIPIEFITF